MTSTNSSSPDPAAAPDAAGSQPPSRRQRRRAAHLAQPGWQRALRWTSIGLMGLAILLVGYVGTLIGYQNYQQHRLNNLFNDRTATAGVHDVLRSAAEQPVLRPHLDIGEPILKLDLPSVGFSAIVTEGADTGVLSGGPGHDIHTGYPGEGSLILIGNHNGFSMSWGDLKVGDHIVLTTSGDGARYTYGITGRSIVDGADQSVVDSRVHGKETLLLTTCWPLWQGSLARQRLVFDATPLVDAAATPTPAAAG